jgi:putative GTP pyrophosphokinase
MTRTFSEDVGSVSASRATDELRGEYFQRLPALRLAKRKLKVLLDGTARAIEDRALVRAEVQSIRIKCLSSIRKKAARNNWKGQNVLTKFGDLIGGRVVCNNVEDVYRFTELLKEQLPVTWYEVQDHIKAPGDDGYRAVHVNFGLGVGRHPFTPDLVTCEVQMRTRLQDAWAVLTHRDIYKNASLPADLRGRAADLAEVLAATDKIATAIRRRVAREAPVRAHPDLSRVSADGLAFVFREVFGRSPPDYVVRQGSNLSDELGLASLTRLSEKLSGDEFRNKVIEAYRSIIGVPPRNEDVFLAGIYAVARHDKDALKWVRRNAHREATELDQIATREALSDLPETVAELIEQLDSPDGSFDIHTAEALGATDGCAVCGMAIVHPYSFAEAVVQYYNLTGKEADEVHARVEKALCNSGIETGGWGDGVFCAYHNEQVEKDE